MRRDRYIYKLIILVFATMFSAMGVSTVFALPEQYSVGVTYFEGSTNFYGIPTNHAGTNSMWGSVMPNHSTKIGTSSGGGAVGLDALGISTSASNKAKKQALYTFLRNKYASSSQWERMGAALIVHQMTGKTGQGWGSGARTISSGTWDELRDRLINNPDVIMKKADYPRRKNTVGVINNSSGNYDAIRYIIEDDVWVDSWIFSVDGVDKYALEIICANPLGNLDGLPEYNPAQYSLTPSITAPTDGASIKRGQSVQANGSVKNNGPDNAGTKTWYITRLLYDPGSSPSNKSARSSNAHKGNLCAEFAGNDDCVPSKRSGTFNSGQTRTGSSSYTVPDDMTPGTKICFVVSVSQPTQKTDDPVWRHSSMRCISVAAPSYSLVPTVSFEWSEGSIVEPGNSTIVTNSVRNVGIDPSDPTLWQLTKFVYGPSATLDDDDGDKDGRDNGSTPCATFTADGRESCDTVQESTSEIFDPGPPKSRNFPFTIPNDTPIGTKICFAVSVSRPTYPSDPLWRHSDMWCITVGKKPKMQVWGGDVRSGGKISTSTSTIASPGTTYGSWVEYAALSIKNNIGFASGAALSEGNSSDEQSSWSELTFANTGVGVSCDFGCYNFSLSSPALVNQFVAQAAAPNLTGTKNLNGLTSGVVYRAGDVKLSGTTITGGKTIIIEATGTVTIQGDITYEDKEYQEISDIPQVIIRAPKIEIEGDVERIDAWLLAVNDDGSGALNTCSDVGVNENLTANDCNNQLVINGPVVADTIYLRRTAGSGGAPDERGDPAEIFNLRADAYLWAYAFGSDSSRAQTVYVKELAPRF